MSEDDLDIALSTIDVMSERLNRLKAVNADLLAAFNEALDRIERIMSERESNQYEALALLVRAYLELNGIRARYGAPDGVCHEYFGDLVDSIDEYVKRLTDKSAHCHPSLYQRAKAEGASDE